MNFVDDVGIPNTLICDLATEQVGPHTPMMKEIRRVSIKLHNSEKGRSTQNHRAETEIRELKRRWKAQMIEKMYRHVCGIMVLFTYLKFYLSLLDHQMVDKAWKR
jgi:hypothetical protein